MYVRRWPRIALVVHAAQTTHDDLRPSARHVWAERVLPTPGGPTKH